MSDISILIGDIVDFLEELAPLAWAEEYDSVGLQVGRPDRSVIAGILALDLTPAVLERAAAEDAGLIITHHPLIFTPLDRVRTDEPQGALLEALLAAGRALYVAHTNLDAAPKVGPAAFLAERLGLQEVRSLRPQPAPAQVKVVTFLPETAVPTARKAMALAGAGRIGAYTQCSYHTIGWGHFQAPAHARPAVGRPGHANLEREARLEMVCPAEAEVSVVEALRRAHPYEEPAIEVYPLRPEAGEAGIGRLGRLPAPLSAARLAAAVKEALGVASVAVAGDGSIETVAVLPGSGKDGVALALGAGAQALVTGELDYHRTMEAVQRGLVVIAAGHAESEALLLPALAAALTERWPDALRVVVVAPEPASRRL